MIHSVFNFPTTVGLLLVCLGVGYGSFRRGDLLWTIGAAGFALYMFWPQWPHQAYTALGNFITISPEGAQLLAAVAFLIAAAWGFKHIFVGDKRTK